MPRPKGSKNKSAALPLAERIDAVSAEIGVLQEKLKDKKSELKRLKNQQAQEEQQRLLEAVDASGMSIAEVIALLEPASPQPVGFP